MREGKTVHAQFSQERFISPYEATFSLLADKWLKLFGSDEYPIRLQEGFADPSESLCSN